MQTNEVSFISGSMFEIEFNVTDINETPITVAPTFEILKKGRVIKSFETNPSENFSFDLSFLESGKYVYRLVNNKNIIQSGRISVQPRL